MFPKTIRVADINLKVSCHVETCVLLSKLKSSKSVSIDLDLDALETTAAEVKATYGEIKWRVEGLSWWSQEMPTKQEMDFGLENLKNAIYEYIRDNVTAD